MQGLSSVEEEEEGLPSSSLIETVGDSCIVVESVDEATVVVVVEVNMRALRSGSTHASRRQRTKLTVTHTALRCFITFMMFAPQGAIFHFFFLILSLFAIVE